MPNMPVTTSEASTTNGATQSSQNQAVIYAPFVSKDMIIQSLGMNLVRERNGKPLLPMIAQDDQALAQLLQLKQQEEQKLRAFEVTLHKKIQELHQQFNLSMDEIRQMMGPADYDEKILQAAAFTHQADVLQQTEIRSNAGGAELGRLRPEHDRIYIIGHGGPGRDILAADRAVTQGRVTAADVAQQLATGGLHRDFRDIRATSCYSADTRHPTSFSPPDLQRAAQAELAPTPSFRNLFGLFSWGQVPRQSFAQSLSSELSRVGYSAVKVTGYHGAGVGFGGQDYNVRRLVDQQGNQSGPDVRASDVKQVFSPTEDVQGSNPQVDAQGLDRPRQDLDSRPHLGDERPSAPLPPFQVGSVSLDDSDNEYMSHDLVSDEEGSLSESNDGDAPPRRMLPTLADLDAPRQSTLPPPLPPFQAGSVSSDDSDNEYISHDLVSDEEGLLSDSESDDGDVPPRRMLPTLADLDTPRQPALPPLPPNLVGSVYSDDLGNEYTPHHSALDGGDVDRRLLPSLADLDARRQPMLPELPSQQSTTRQAVLYSPFASEDMITQSLGRNLIRKRNGKPLLPLIAQDDQAQAQLLQLKRQREQEYRAEEAEWHRELQEWRQESKLSPEEIRQWMDQHHYDRRVADFIYQLDVLQQMEIRSNAGGAELSKLRPAHDKIYIIGHGTAGMDFLAADTDVTQGMVTAADVAQQLIDGGLHRDFSDVRVTACYSADTQKPTSFDLPDLQHAAQAELGPIPGSSESGVLKQSFAQSLSNELVKAGYSAIKVTGYHGLGFTFPEQNYKVRHLLDEEGNWHGLEARAADVKQVFSPTEDVQGSNPQVDAQGLDRPRQDLDSRPHLGDDSPPALPPKRSHAEAKNDASASGTESNLPPALPPKSDQMAADSGAFASDTESDPPPVLPPKRGQTPADSDRPTASGLGNESNPLLPPKRVVVIPDERLQDLITSTELRSGPTDFSYQAIRAQLEKVHATNGNVRLQASFMLYRDVAAYLIKHPGLGLNQELVNLQTQIGDLLFSGDLKPRRAVVLEIAQTQPALAARLYQIAILETQGHAAGLTDLALRWVSMDAEVAEVCLNTMMDVEQAKAKWSASSSLMNKVGGLMFSEELQPLRASLLEIAQTRPQLAAHIYQIARGEALGYVDGLTHLVVRWASVKPGEVETCLKILMGSESEGSPLTSTAQIRLLNRIDEAARLIAPLGSPGADTRYLDLALVQWQRTRPSEFHQIIQAVDYLKRRQYTKSVGLLGLAMPPTVAEAFADRVEFDGIGRIVNLKTELPAADITRLVEQQTTPLTQRNAAGVRNTPRTETESLITFVSELRRVATPEALVLAERAQGLWLNGRVNTEESKALYRDAAMQLQGQPELVQLAETLLADANKQKATTQYIDNLFGRYFDTEFAQALVLNPTARAKEASVQMGQFLVQEYEQRLETSYPDPVQRTQRIAENMQGFASVIREDFRPWFNQVPEVTAFLNSPDYAHFKVMMTKVDDGFGMIKVPYLAVKLATTAEMGFREATWMRRADSFYHEHIIAARSTSTDLATGIDTLHQVEIKDQPTQGSGPLQPHQRGLQSDNDFALSKDWAAAKVPTPGQETVFERNALAHGQSVVGGASGSTNVLVHLYQHIDSELPNFSPQQAYLNSLAFLVFDGGHSVNESLVVHEALRARGNLRANVLNSYTVNYNDLINIAETSDQQSAVRQALNKAFDETLALHQRLQPEVGGSELNEQRRAMFSISEGDLWRVADTAELTARAVGTEDTSFNYEKQLIVQADGSETVFNAAKDLFNKHPKHSDWAQLKDGQLQNRLGWDATTNQVRLLEDAPLSLDSDGQVRLVLVGQGSTDAAGVTHFGGKTAAQWQPALQSILDQLPANTVKGLRLDLVGCELVNGNPRESLPGQLATWLEAQAKQRGWSDGASISARKDLVSVDANGKKWTYDASLGWINKEEAGKRNLSHKVEWKWDALTQKLIEPSESDYRRYVSGQHQLPQDLDSRPHLGGENQPVRQPSVDFGNSSDAEVADTQSESTGRLVSGTGQNGEPVYDTIAEDHVPAADNRLVFGTEGQTSDAPALPPRRLMSVDELTKAAYVRGKPRGESYQRVLDALADYHAASKSARNDKQELFTKLEQLRQRLEHYISEHPDSGRLGVMVSLLEQVKRHGEPLYHTIDDSDSGSGTGQNGEPFYHVLEDPNEKRGAGSAAGQEGEPFYHVLEDPNEKRGTGSAAGQEGESVYHTIDDGRNGEPAYDTIAEDHVPAADNRLVFGTEGQTSDAPALPPRRLMSVDELTKVAYVRGKPRGESYQRVLDALADYHAASKSARNDKQELFTKLEQLRQRLEHYISEHPDSGRLGVMVSLLEQVKLHGEPLYHTIDDSDSGSSTGQNGERFYHVLENPNEKRGAGSVVGQDGQSIPDTVLIENPLYDTAGQTSDAEADIVHRSSVDSGHGSDTDLIENSLYGTAGQTSDAEADIVRRSSVDSGHGSDTESADASKPTRGRTDFIQELLKRSPEQLERYATRRNPKLKEVFDYVYRDIDPDGKFANITRNYISKEHFLAVSLAASVGNFSVSAREAGALTLDQLANGAAAKGHDILEKTVKSSSLTAAYGAESAQQKLRLLGDLGLAGLVGHWDPQSKALLGIYVTQELYALRDSANPAERSLGEKVLKIDDGHFYYPVDMTDDSTIRSSTDALRSSAQWQQRMFTGDYDLHDMVSFSGSGGAHSVPSGSLDEVSIRNMLNAAVAASDGNRPVRRGSHHTIQHGPQVSYPAHMGTHEPGVPLVGAVAQPSFPLALCDRGEWTLIHNVDELKAAYSKMGAQLKVTWQMDENLPRFVPNGDDGTVVLERRPSMDVLGNDNPPARRPTVDSGNGGSDENSGSNAAKPITPDTDVSPNPQDRTASVRRNALEQLAIEQMYGESLSQRWYTQIEALMQKNQLGKDWMAVGGVEADADGQVKQRFVNTQDGSDKWLNVSKKHQQLFNDFATHTKNQAKQIRLQRRESIRDGVGGVFGLAMNTFSLVQTIREHNPMNQGIGVLNRVAETPVEIAAQVQVITQLVQSPISFVDDGKQLLDAIRSFRGAATKSSFMFGKAIPVASLVLDGINIGALSAEFHNETDPERRKVLAANIGVSVIGAGLAIAGLVTGMLGLAAAPVIGWIALPVAAVGMAITYAVQYFSGQATKYEEVKGEFEKLMNDVSQPGFFKKDGVWQVGTGVVRELNFQTGQMRYGRVRVTPTYVGGLSTLAGHDHVTWHEMGKGTSLTMEEQIALERGERRTELYNEMRTREAAMLDVYAAYGIDKDYDYAIDIDTDAAVLLPNSPDVDLVPTVGAVADKRSYVRAYGKLREKYGEKFVHMFHQWGIGTDYSFTGLESEFYRTNVLVTLDNKARTLIVPTLQGKQVGYMEYTLQGNGGVYSLVLSPSTPSITIKASASQEELWVFDISQASHQYVVSLTAAGAHSEFMRLANKAAQNGNTLSASELQEYQLYKKRMEQQYFAPRRNVFADLRIMREQISFSGQILRFNGSNTPRVMLTDMIADGVRLQLTIDFQHGTKTVAAIYIDKASPLNPHDYNKLLDYFKESGLGRHLQHSSPEIVVRGKWTGSLNVKDNIGFLINSQSRTHMGSEEHDVVWLKDHNTAPFRVSIPGSIEQVTKLEDKFRLSGSFTLPTGQDKGRFVFETPRLVDIQRGEMGAIPGLQCRELDVGRHDGFFNSLLRGRDWRRRGTRPDSSQMARHVQEDFPTFYGEFSEGATIKGVNEQGQVLQLHFVNGGMELKSASWQRDGASYQYLDEVGKPTSYLVNGGLAETLTLNDSDLESLPLRHHDSPALLLRLTAATQTVSITDRWRQVAAPSIVLADRPGVKIILDGHMNYIAWERDGNDVLLINRGQTVLKLLDVLAPERQFARAYTQLQLNNMPVLLQDILARAEQRDHLISDLSVGVPDAKHLQQLLAPQMLAKSQQANWQSITSTTTPTDGMIRPLLAGVTLHLNQEQALIVVLDNSVVINADWLTQLNSALKAWLTESKLMGLVDSVMVQGEGTVGVIDFLREQSLISETASNRVWINGQEVMCETAVTLVGHAKQGIAFRGKHPLGEFTASGWNDQGWQLHELRLEAGNTGFYALLRELRQENQAQVVTRWLRNIGFKTGFVGNLVAGGMIEGVNAQGQRLRLRVGERVELDSAEWQREDVIHRYQKKPDGSWQYLLQGGEIPRVTLHARDLQLLPLRGEGACTSLLTLSSATREVVLDSELAVGTLSIWQPAGNGLKLHCTGTQADWQWRQEGHDIVLSSPGQSQVRWLNVRSPSQSSQWAHAQLQFGGQQVSLAQFVSAVPGDIAPSTSTPPLLPAVQAVDGGDQERVTLRASEVPLPSGEGPRPIELYNTAATRQLVIAADWPDHAPIYISPVATQRLTIQWQGKWDDVHWDRDGEDLVLWMGNQEKVRWLDLFADDQRAALQHARLQLGDALLALTDFPPSIQIADGVLLGRSGEPPQATVWLTQTDINSALDELQRYFATPAARARLKTSQLQIAGEWQGEFDLESGKGLLAKVQDGVSTLQDWHPDIHRRSQVSFVGAAQVVRDVKGLGFVGNYEQDGLRVDFSAQTIRDGRVLLDALAIEASDHQLAALRSRGSLQAWLDQHRKKLSLNEGTLVEWKDDAGEVSIWQVADQRLLWQYPVTAAERITLGTRAMPAVLGESWVNLKLQAQTRELVVPVDWQAPVEIKIVPGQQLTVQYLGGEGPVSWDRHGDDLLLIQAGQVKVRWLSLLAAEHRLELQHAKLQWGNALQALALCEPNRQITDGVTLTHYVQPGEQHPPTTVALDVASQESVASALTQIQAYFAGLAGHEQPPAGRVQIRGRWKGELDLTRGVALLEGATEDSDGLSYAAVLRWDNGVSRNVTADDLFATMKGEVVRNTAGGLSYRGSYYPNWDDNDSGFHFIADEVEGAVVTVRELWVDSYTRHMWLSSRSNVQDSLNSVGFGINLADGAVLSLFNEHDQAVKYKVQGELLELQRMTWQRDGIDHVCVKETDGSWRYQVSGSNTRVELKGADLAMFPDTDQSAVTLTLPGAMQELVLDAAWTRAVNITPAATQRLTVSLKGEQHDLSWSRIGDDLVLSQGGQIRVRWSSLLSAEWGDVLANAQLQIDGEVSCLSSIVSRDLPRPAVAEGSSGQQEVEQLRQALCSFHPAGHGEGALRVPSQNHARPPLLTQPV
ncbi:membrane-targeted effector domain-containing toxin [Chitinimonas sp. PSY-7]|uniref:membrane-targeted effector domain-containing toxin n=1 Tax=Chitinimonas sp. PSY-7 TaxID=3459088 RepID=UPI004040027B